MVADGPGRIEGPRGAPLIGSLPQLARDPLGFLTQLSRDHGDLVPYRIGRQRHWMLSDPDLIEEVLVTHRHRVVKDEVTRSLSRLLGQGLLTSENPRWRRNRKLAAPSFQPRHLFAYGEAMVEATRRRLAIVGDGPRDVYADMTEITLEIVLRTLFGSMDPTSERVGRAVVAFMESFEEEVRSFRRLLPAWVPTAGRKRIAHSRRVLADALQSIIADRQRADDPGDDLLGRLLAARDDEGAGMDAVQLKDEAITLFAAGHETTALTLSYALWLVARRPEIAATLATERREVCGDRDPTAADLPALVWHDAVIRESMRLYPPAWMVGRRPTEPIEVGGQRIDPADQLMMPQWVVHRDPRWWPDPEAFRPERWRSDTPDRPRFAYFPFGGGPRVCVGNHFAQMEAVLVLAAWLSQVDAAPVPEARLSLMPAVTLRPRTGVHLDLTRRP